MRKKKERQDAVNAELNSFLGGMVSAGVFGRAIEACVKAGFKGMQIKFLTEEEMKE